MAYNFPRAATWAFNFFIHVGYLSVSRVYLLVVTLPHACSAVGL